MTEINPWTTIRKKAVYENNWIKVVHHDVLNAVDKEGVYGTVHFKNIAIGIIPLNENGQTVLVGQYRFPLKAYSWEIPEGGGDLMADPLESAKRELKEECGLTAKKWTIIQKIHTSNSVTDEFGLIYLAENLQQGEAEPDEDELLELKWLKLEEAVQWVHDGKITDSLSVCGLLKAAYLKI